MSVTINVSMPMDDYIDLRAVSSGLIHRIDTTSPRHAWEASPWNPDRQSDSSRASDIGTVAHSAILEGHLNNVAVIDPRDHPAEKTGNIPDGWTNKSIRAARDAAIDAGKTPILATAMPAIEAMVESAIEYVRHSDYPHALSNGIAEATATWEDCGLLCKARPDYVNDGLVLHLKTTGMSVRPESFERTAINLGYDISLAFYRRAFQIPQMILAVEQAAPYACKFFTLSSAQYDISARRIDRALQVWQLCVERGSFPAYAGSAHEIYPTSWQMLKAEESLTRPLPDDFLDGTVPL
jgi:hypothetical protein